MTSQAALQHSQEVLHLLDQAAAWLKRSFQQCQNIDVHEALQPEQYDALETLTSRFARVSDIIVQQMFRAIDKVELEEGGSLLDALNRAHKRNLIPSVDALRDVRDLRNEIAHTYQSDNLSAFHGEIMIRVPMLFDVIERCRNYLSDRTATL